MFDTIMGSVCIALSVALCIFAAYAGTHGKPSPFAIEASDAPDIFCPTVGCRYMADHEGCCGECDICAVFGSHNAPIYDFDNDFDDEYIGKHRAYNPHKVYRGEMNAYVGKHSEAMNPMFD